MREKFRKIWTDPVWSKVIAQIIIVVGGLIILSFFKSLNLNNEGNFWTALKEVLTFKIGLWIYLLFTPLLIFIFLPRQKFRSTLTPSLDKEECEIQITSHTNESKISRIENVSGTYKVLPDNAKIRLFVVDENQSKCWLNSRKVVINNSARTWEAVTYFGSEADTKKTFYLAVAIDTERTDHWVKYHAEASLATQHWHPFDYPLAESLIECQKIKVHRIK